MNLKFTVGLLTVSILGVLVVSACFGEEVPFIPWFTSTYEDYVTVNITTTPGGFPFPPPGVYTVKRGTTITLQVADVYSGFEFDHWHINFVNYSTSPFTAVTLEGDANITAVFVEAPVSWEAGYLVVDLAFYDKPSLAPKGYVIVWELGLKEVLVEVPIAPNQWHSQAVFAGVRIGKTYTVVVILENGLKGTYITYWTAYSKVSYMHWGFTTGYMRMPRTESGYIYIED
ncbi:MAG: hypothetical protein QXT14_08465 [Candidatus Bathyarchaeia archaeon]